MEENKKSLFDKVSIPASIIIAGLLIGGGIYLNGKISKSNPTSVQQQKMVSNSLKDVLRPVSANDHILGSDKARLIVVEYSDTGCPFCKSFHETMLSVMQNYGKEGTVAWVYRHAPLVENHTKAFKEAEATECAAKLGGNSKFWEYTNKLYEITPSNDGLDPKELTNIAKNVGLSVDDFNVCLQSGEFVEKINEDLKNFKDLGAEGTPFSVIIDTKTREYYPINGYRSYIDTYYRNQIVTGMKSIIDMILKS